MSWGDCGLDSEDRPIDALDTDIDDVLIKNINKLKVRYPEKFTSKDALNRNLDKEDGERVGSVMTNEAILLA